MVAICADPATHPVVPSYANVQYIDPHQQQMGLVPYQPASTAPSATFLGTSSVGSRDSGSSGYYSQTSATVAAPRFTRPLSEDTEIAVTKMTKPAVTKLTEPAVTQYDGPYFSLV